MVHSPEHISLLLLFYRSLIPSARLLVLPFARQTVANLVPTRPDDPASDANRRAWEVLHRWDKPFLTAFSDSDPITAGGDRVFQADVPGTNGRPHTTIEGAGHFLQEDRGVQIARVVVDFITATPGS